MNRNITIVDPNETFDFNTIRLSHPVSISGGGYFTKIEHNKSPLYIQTTKCVTKHGIVKSGKKYYCDLMFDKYAESLIQWFETLEERCQALIFQKKDEWFQGHLEPSDIESAFIPAMRIYKSGKQYAMRTNVKSKDDLLSIRIYDEHQRPLERHDITSDTLILTIVEVQGIKFTSRTFQIELELKQIMVIKEDEALFEHCVIQTRGGVLEHQCDPLYIPPSLQDKGAIQHMNLQEEDPAMVEEVQDFPTMIDEKREEEQIKEEKREEVQDMDSILQLPAEKETFDSFATTSTVEKEEQKDEKQEKEEKEKEEKEKEEKEKEEKEKEEKEKEEEETKDGLMELNDINIDESAVMTLKKPDEVYFALYKEAREKAKRAKQTAIVAYLEAKNIKKTYMIETHDDSDSDQEERYNYGLEEDV